MIYVFQKILKNFSWNTQSGTFQLIQVLRRLKMSQSVEKRNQVRQGPKRCTSFLPLTSAIPHFVNNSSLNFKS